MLLDGRRAGPAGTRGAVGAFDLNVVPLSAIERVEILKDGASSIYGSDAVAGVVNIITKKGDGADIDIFASAPLNGGGEQFRINGSWGETFNEKLHVRVTADYFKQQALRRGDRDFFSCSQPYVFRADGSRADLVDPRTGKFICSGDLPWGHVWYYDYEEPGAITRPWQARPQFIQFNYGNKLQQFLPGFGPTTNPATFPAGWFPVGYGELNRPTATPDPFYQPSASVSEALIDYKHPYQDLVSLSPEVERMTVMGSGEYDLSDSMQLYGEVLLNRRMTKSYGYRQFWTYQYVAERRRRRLRRRSARHRTGLDGPQYRPQPAVDHGPLQRHDHRRLPACRGRRPRRPALQHAGPGTSPRNSRAPTATTRPTSSGTMRSRLRSSAMTAAPAKSRSIAARRAWTSTGTIRTS